MNSVFSLSVTLNQYLLAEYLLKGLENFKAMLSLLSL